MRRNMTKSLQGHASTQWLMTCHTASQLDKKPSCYKDSQPYCRCGTASQQT